MSATVDKKLNVQVVCNGTAKLFQVEPEELVAALLSKAIAAFRITQNPHLLSLYLGDGNVVPENESVAHAGLKPDEIFLLRPDAVIDVVSAGAICQAALYSLMRLPNPNLRGRVFDDDVTGGTNLNRNMVTLAVLSDKERKLA